GMPGQRATRTDLPAGVPPGQRLDRDDAAGPVADDVGEAARRRMVSQVSDGLIQGARAPLEPAGDEVPAGVRARRSGWQMVDGPDQAGAGNGERGAGQETWFPERGDRWPALERQREQRVASFEELRVVLVMRDEGLPAPPGQVAAAVTIADDAEVTAEVQ